MSLFETKLRKSVIGNIFHTKQYYASYYFTMFYVIGSWFWKIWKKYWTGSVPDTLLKINFSKNQSESLTLIYEIENDYIFNITNI